MNNSRRLKRRSTTSRKPTSQTQTRTTAYDVADSERLFSNSSLTCLKSLELLRDGEETDDASVFKQPSTPGALTTVVVPPAAGRHEMDQSQIKKHRDREYQRRKRASASQRDTSDEETIPTSSRRNKKARMDD
uniref:Uncharacterized protein n=1 Tax=Mycena chlorophos TaxID=658473 RepID=A0ABQ0MAC4_MYCCL|nr:predicted protein [Mycena chlorophos]